MAAYVIIDLTINDKETIVEYQKLAPATIEAYNGKFIVRGGQITTLEGAWRPTRIVIIEFASRERAEEWWHSEIYSKAKQIRQRAAKTNLVIVDGL
jgi:uncharacterized protein (DUF1330 family)